MIAEAVRGSADAGRAMRREAGAGKGRGSKQKDAQQSVAFSTQQLPSGAHGTAPSSRDWFGGTFVLIQANQRITELLVATLGQGSSFHQYTNKEGGRAKTP